MANNPIKKNKEHSLHKNENTDHNYTSIEISSEEDLTITKDELHWYKNVYQGDHMPQLTLRALVMGGLLGGIMSLSNLYVGLKTGWNLGVAITSCILSYSIYKTLMELFPKLFATEMSILENNCMQSTASSAGVATAGTLVSAIPAYLMVTGANITGWLLLLWVMLVGSLGVFMAIPMKRQMINIEQLKFPSGVAAAEVLRSLHSKGLEASQKARALGIGGALGALIAWFRDFGKPFSIPSHLYFPGSINGFPLKQFTISFELSTLLMAAGAIMGWKAAWSLLLGSSINYLYLAPWMVQEGAIDSTKLGYRAIVSWSTWTGGSIMVTSALVSLAFQWKTIGRALQNSLKRNHPKKSSLNNQNTTKNIAQSEGVTERKSVVESIEEIMSRIEVPASWFFWGAGLSGAGCVALLYFFFGTKIWMGVVAVLISFLLAIVACRATGETDTTPLGAMGKITQLTFGILAPSNLVTNLMTAGITSGAASASSDLLTDLKSGYLLGANPRKQFWAQFSGIFVGALVIVPTYFLIVPNAAVLGTDQWPAPAAQVWAAVAKLLSNGLDSLHPTARMGILYGILIGTLLPTFSRFFPQWNKYIPSATGLGLSFVIPFFNSLSMFIGALIALILERKTPALAEKYIIPLSSGLIAGESIMGIVIALIQVF